MRNYSGNSINLGIDKNSNMTDGFAEILKENMGNSFKGSQKRRKEELGSEYRKLEKVHKDTIDEMRILRSKVAEELAEYLVNRDSPREEEQDPRPEIHQRYIFMRPETITQEAPEVFETEFEYAPGSEIVYDGSGQKQIPHDNVIYL